jgi:DNA polymerase I
MPAPTSSVLAPSPPCLPPSSGKTLALIDGHALAYRMYFALERTNMSTADGTTTWAIYGFFKAIFDLLQSHRPDAMAMAFDTPAPTFRKAMYEPYKAHRAEMPEALRQQIDILLDGVQLLNIPLFRVEGVEADDVIGTLSRQALNTEGWHVEILTGDQDAFQLVEPDNRVTVLIPGRGPKEGLKRYGWQQVFEKTGVWPNQITDFKGLKGDSSDNIPGVPGIGDKTGAKLLADFPTLEAVYANLPQTGSPKLQEKLATNQALAELSKRLATIVRDVPQVSLALDECHLDLPNPQALRDYFQQLEFRSFLGQWDTLLAPFIANSPQAAATALQALPPEPAAPAKEPEIKKYPAYVPEIITDEAALVALIAEIKAAGIMAIDLETTGLDPFTAQPVGIALAVGNGLKLATRTTRNPLGISDEYPAQVATLESTGRVSQLRSVYIPVGHTSLLETEFQQLPWDVVKAHLAPLLADEGVLKLVHNTKYETNVLHAWGLPFAAPVWDSLIASYVVQPDRKHGLKALAADLLGLEMQSFEGLTGKGKQQKLISEVPIAQAAQYAACDGYATWCLAHYLVSRMSLTQRCLMDELDMPTAGVLATMERTGIRIDVPHLAGLSQTLGGRLAELEQAVYGLAGEPFNLNSTQQLGDVLFNKLGIKPLRKTAGKTGYSTDASVLEELAPQHPIVQHMLEYRQLYKLKSTYIDALPTFVKPQTGRIHTSFNQTLTATGRLSSFDPNLQNIPIRSEWGRLIRGAFVPGLAPADEAPWVLLSADYSQIELRVLAHLSGDPRLVQAFRSGEDIHTATAALVFGVPVDQVSKDQRYQAKAVNFGIVYGQTAHGLAGQMGVSRSEAQGFIDRYFDTYPGVKTIIEQVKQKAHDTGRVSTLFGRTRDLSEGLNSKIKSIREFAERAAFNTPIQGSAADLVKLAMIRVSKGLTDQGLASRLLLQVHDELVLEVPPHELEAVTALVQTAMELGQPLQVPLVVDIAVSDSWME